jgi:hypothetical protein
LQRETGHGRSFLGKGESGFGECGVENGGCQWEKELEICNEGKPERKMRSGEDFPLQQVMM